MFCPGMAPVLCKMSQKDLSAAFFYTAASFLASMAALAASSE